MQRSDVNPRAVQKAEPHPWARSVKHTEGMFNHQVAALFSVKWHHGRHLERVMSNRKSDTAKWCIFTWRTFTPNFILIPF